MSDMWINYTQNYRLVRNFGRSPLIEDFQLIFALTFVPKTVRWTPDIKRLFLLLGKRGSLFGIFTRCPWELVFFWELVIATSLARFDTFTDVIFLFIAASNGSIWFWVGLVFMILGVFISLFLYSLIMIIIFCKHESSHEWVAMALRGSENILVHEWVRKFVSKGR